MRTLRSLERGRYVAIIESSSCQWRRISAQPLDECVRDELNRWTTNDRSPLTYQGGCRGGNIVGDNLRLGVVCLSAGSRSVGNEARGFKLACGFHRDVASCVYCCQLCEAQFWRAWESYCPPAVSYNELW